MVESAIVDRYREKYDVPQNTRSKKQACPSTPCFPASTTQPQLLQVPGLAAAAGLDLYHGATRAGPARQRAAQLLKHSRSPPLCDGPRGPMVSYFGTLTGFHSAPSQPIVSRRRERALDVLELEHGDGNVSHQVLRSGLSSNVLPSPPMVF